MKATDLDLQEKDVEALRQEKAYVRKRRLAILFVVAAVIGAATLAAVVLERMQNKLHLIDVTELQSIQVFDKVGNVRVDVKPQLWARLVDNFSSSYINMNPAKWQELASITMTFKNGEQQVIHVYDTGKKPGCFRVGRTYYTGGEERMLIRIMADQSKRDRR